MKKSRIIVITASIVCLFVIASGFYLVSSGAYKNFGLKVPESFSELKAKDLADFQTEIETDKSLSDIPREVIENYTVFFYFLDHEKPSFEMFTKEIAKYQIARAETKGTEYELPPERVQEIRDSIERDYEKNIKEDPDYYTATGLTREQVVSARTHFTVANDIQYNYLVLITKEKLFSNYDYDAASAALAAEALQEYQDHIQDMLAAVNEYIDEKAEMLSAKLRSSQSFIDNVKDADAKFSLDANSD